MKKHAFPVEIHTHTEHSDGNFTSAELVQAGKDFGYKGMILTDHNSSSGYNEMITAGLTEDKDFILLKGMEWTTYFGHMLVHDAVYDVDWREATPETIDTYMIEVKEAGGLVGIAHPFDIGSPICTGCHWDFNVEDYRLVDYIEIWNSNQPQVREESAAAYHMWLDLLAEGYQISASTGRDWHRPDDKNSNMGVTYVEIKNKELTKENFKQALAEGSFYITLGPEVHFKVSKDEKNYFIGDRVAKENIQQAKVQMTLSKTTLKDLKSFSVENFKVQLWHNDQIIYISDKQKSLTDSTTYEFQLPVHLEKGYLRYEVVGEFRNHTNTKIVVGNPLYIH